MKKYLLVLAVVSFFSFGSAEARCRGGLLKSKARAGSCGSSCGGSKILHGQILGSRSSGCASGSCSASKGSENKGSENKGSEKPKPATAPSTK